MGPCSNRQSGDYEVQSGEPTDIVWGSVLTEVSKVAITTSSVILNQENKLSEFIFCTLNGISIAYKHVNNSSFALQMLLLLFIIAFN